MLALRSPHEGAQLPRAPARRSLQPVAAQKQCRQQRCQQQQLQQRLEPPVSRRHLLSSSAAAAALAAMGGPATWQALPAAASGLLQFPVNPTDLHNTYYLVRAGESEAEAAGYVLTNPGMPASLRAAPGSPLRPVMPAGVERATLVLHKTCCLQTTQTSASGQNQHHCRAVPAGQAAGEQVLQGR